MISSTIATALATVAAATEESRQCVANLTIPFAQAAHHARGLPPTSREFEQIEFARIENGSGTRRFARMFSHVRSCVGGRGLAATARSAFQPGRRSGMFGALPCAMFATGARN